MACDVSRNKKVQNDLKDVSRGLKSLSKSMKEDGVAERKEGGVKSFVSKAFYGLTLTSFLFRRK